MKKDNAIRTKRGARYDPTTRTIQDKSATTRAAFADRVPSSTGISVTDTGRGFPSFNRGGFRAFAPGPAAKASSNPFGYGPEVAFDFWNMR